MRGRGGGAASHMSHTSHLLPGLRPVARPAPQPAPSRSRRTAEKDWGWTSAVGQHSWMELEWEWECDECVRWEREHTRARAPPGGQQTRALEAEANDNGVATRPAHAADAEVRRHFRGGVPRHHHDTTTSLATTPALATCSRLRIAAGGGGHRPLPRLAAGTGPAGCLAGRPRTPPARRAHELKRLTAIRGQPDAMYDVPRRRRRRTPRRDRPSPCPRASRGQPRRPAPAQSVETSLAQSRASLCLWPLARERGNLVVRRGVIQPVVGSYPNQHPATEPPATQLLATATPRPLLPQPSVVCIGVVVSG